MFPRDGVIRVAVYAAEKSSCRRWSASAIPSSTALEHNAMRVTLIYEFVVKMRRLRERAKRSHISWKRRRDREEEGEDSRRRKRTRDDGPNRGRRYEDQDFRRRR